MPVKTYYSTQTKNRMFNRRLLKILALFLTVGGVVFLAGFQFGEIKARHDFRQHLQQVMNHATTLVEVDSLFNQAGDLVKTEYDTTAYQITTEQLTRLGSGIRREARPR